MCDQVARRLVFLRGIQVNTAEYKTKFLRSMIDASKIQEIKTDFHNSNFIAQTLGYPLPKKEMHPKTRKALDSITENLVREGIIKRVK